MAAAVQVTRYFALSHPSLNDLLLMFDVAVCTMMLMTLPQLWYHWTQEERGARLRMFDWQLELPLFGIYTKKLFECVALPLPVVLGHVAVHAPHTLTAVLQATIQTVRLVMRAARTRTAETAVSARMKKQRVLHFQRLSALTPNLYSSSKQTRFRSSVSLRRRLAALAPAAYVLSLAHPTYLGTATLPPPPTPHTHTTSR